jgi:hypothetical protein
MCGNFGLLQIGLAVPVNSQSFEKKAIDDNGILDHGFEKKQDSLDISLHESLHEVSRLRGLRLSDRFENPREISEQSASSSKQTKNQSIVKLLSPLVILQSQTASTEIRGGQAGGYSSLEYDGQGSRDVSMNVKRVRLVARKRHALAADLAILYKKKGGRTPTTADTLSVIGHTRFATSSANQVSGNLLNDVLIANSLSGTKTNPVGSTVSIIYSVALSNRTPSSRMGSFPS